MILINFIQIDNLATNLARVLVSLQLVLSYPLILLPGRESMVSFWLTMCSIFQNQSTKHDFLLHNKFHHDIEKNSSNMKNNQEKNEFEVIKTNNDVDNNNEEENENENEERDNIELLEGIVTENQIQQEEQIQKEQNQEEQQEQVKKEGDIEMVIQEGTSNPLNSTIVEKSQMKAIHNSNRRRSLSHEEEDIIRQQKNRRFNIATVRNRIDFDDCNIFFLIFNFRFYFLDLHTVLQYLLLV